MFGFALALGLVAAFGFALGVRPGRPKRPTFSSVFLPSFFSGLVLLSAWVLLSESSAARLLSWGFDDYDLLVVYPALGLFSVVGGFLVAYSWSFAFGCAVTARRLRKNQK